MPLFSPEPGLRNTRCMAAVRFGNAIWMEIGAHGVRHSAQRLWYCPGSVDRHNQCDGIVMRKTVDFCALAQHPSLS